MTPNDWLMVGFLLTTVVLSCTCRWHREREDREWAELHAPLSPNSTDRRLDAALRSANAGAISCELCGFQNFRNRIFCALCGERITSTKRAQRPHDRQPPPHRMRTPSEWARKVDVEGQLYWYRSSLDQGSDEAPCSQAWPSLVVRFEQQPQQQKSLEPYADLNAIAAALEEETATNTLRLEDPATANPAAAFSSTWTRSRANEFVQLTQQDFPTRVAEFVISVAARQTAKSHDSPESTPLVVHRGASLLPESITALASLTPLQAQLPIRITFVGEPAVDAGGVYREWCSLMSDRIATPEAGIFTCVNTHDQTFYLTKPHGTTDRTIHLARVFAAGRFIGRALLDGNCLGFHLAKPLLKIILGQPVGFQDLHDYDPDLSKNLQWLVDNDVESLGLDFSVCEQLQSAGCDVHVMELVTDGSSIGVTGGNKIEYIHRMTTYRLVESVSSELYAFLKGLYDIIPQELLALFDAVELDCVICGTDEIDVADWQRHTRYTQDLWHHTRRWFWEIVTKMPQDYQRRLLQFASGSSRVPLGGFAELTSYDGRLSPFTLVGRPLTDEGFVRSHSCFNTLDVPLYVNKRHLERGLYALLATDVYGFSIV